MGSQTRSIKIPAVLLEAGMMRAKALGYDSWGAWVKGLMRYDMEIQGPHDRSLAWSKMTPEEQAALDANLMEYTKAGVGRRGTLLRHIVKDEIEKVQKKRSRKSASPHDASSLA